MIGTDIIEIDRIAEAAERESFYKGVFTDCEREYYETHGKRTEILAGLFCAKEAVVKALGTGFSGFRPCDGEIFHESSGTPKARLLGKAKEKFPSAQIEVSISHCKTYATAVAVIK